MSESAGSGGTEATGLRNAVCGGWTRWRSLAFERSWERWWEFGRTARLKVHVSTALPKPGRNRTALADSFRRRRTRASACVPRRPSFSTVTACVHHPSLIATYDLPIQARSPWGYFLLL